jgi:16S rRNA (uracil1498-N3)-methyltransferase
MHYTRLYSNTPLDNTETIQFDDTIAHYLKTVLRLTIHDKVILFHDNIEATARITHLSKKDVSFHIEHTEKVSRETFLTIHLAQSIGKGDKMEWIIQKATELGVKTITPLITQHQSYGLTQDKLIKKHHQWQAIIESAAAQSGRNQLPILNQAMRLAVFFEQFATTQTYLLSPNATIRFKDTMLDTPNTTLLIGPEGGFSSEEIAFCLEKGCQLRQLGPRVLRTETAGLTAISVIQGLFGDM